MSPLGRWGLGASAAWTRSGLAHPDLNGGLAFLAAWDRRARVTLLADSPAVPGDRLALAWTGALGAPNPLADEPGEADRLGSLSRLDLRLAGHRFIGAATVPLAVAVRNAFDRDHAVVREPTPLVGRSGDGTLRLGVAPLDVYDVNILPALDLAVRC